MMDHTIPSTLYSCDHIIRIFFIGKEGLSFFALLIKSFLFASCAFSTQSQKEHTKTIEEGGLVRWLVGIQIVNVNKD